MATDPGGANPHGLGKLIGGEQVGGGTRSRWQAGMAKLDILEPYQLSQKHYGGSGTTVHMRENHN